MVLILEVPLACIAIVLSGISWRTLRSIKHLSVGKSFWIPVLLSGIFFFAGSILAILSDLGFSFTAHTVEVVSVSRLLALCFLVGGISTYSRKIAKNLGEKLTLPVRTVEVESNEETETSESIIEQLGEKTVEKKVDCKHQLGYLRTLPRRAHIPEECLGCHRIIECKYSIVKKEKIGSTVPTASKTIPDMMTSDAILEKEENANGSR
jgi:hypothetical protein